MGDKKRYIWKAGDIERKGKSRKKEADKIPPAYDAVSVKDVVPDVQPYPRTRREYVSTVGLVVSGYLESGGARHKNLMKRTVSNLFPEAFYRGYSEAGGEETEDEDEEWLGDKTTAELGFVDDLFSSLKIIRAGDDFDADAIADARADGYADTLDAVYAEGKLRGDKNKVYEFKGHDGKENCAKCKGLKGKRMKAKKIIAEGLIPSPGNENFYCLGYGCEHYWEADDGTRL